MDQIHTWTWIQLAHMRPSNWQAVPWSIGNSLLSCPIFKAKHWQCDGLLHHGISQWCYNTHISEPEHMELQEILHQISAWAVIDKHLPERVRPSCPPRAGSSGKLPYLPLSCYEPWLSPSPLPCKHQLFSRLLIQFHSEKPLRSGAKVHMQILHQAANSCKVPLFSHPSQALICD